MWRMRPEGGAAGNVDYSKELKPFVDSGKLKLEAKAGDPGPGGPGGFGGIAAPGEMAAMEAMRRWGNAGAARKRRRSAQRTGRHGATEGARKDGIITCYNCQ